MNADRKVRFLVPPLLFLASIAGGMRLDPRPNLKDLAGGLLGQIQLDKWTEIVTLVAGGGIFVFSAGYIFGTITRCVLRLVLRRPHEMMISEQGALDSSPLS